jgi:Na+-translocating ferredoxin:NAD+ oxidoreductase RNF subunit RnfB
MPARPSPAQRPTGGPLGAPGAGSAPGANGLAKGHIIDPAACVACLACARTCPTRAIRVREGPARISYELCIDCGACVRACQHGAARAATTPPSDLQRFEYTVAVPSLTLYAQFGRDVAPARVLHALTQIGFDAAYDLSWMCEMLAGATDAYVTEGHAPWPKISVTCPAVVRLIQVRYPGLIANLVPIETARELAGKLLRRRLTAELGLPPDEIGIFFITPCTAIMDSILSPVGLGRSYLDGALSIAELYGPLLRALETAPPADALAEEISPRGLLWAMAGGEIAGMRDANTMTVRGSDVQRVFDRIEAGTYQGVDFIEAYICPDGCVSGGLTIEGRCAAQRNVQHIARSLRASPAVGEERIRRLLREDFFSFEEGISARPVQPLGRSLQEAVARQKELEALVPLLPGKDCAACGAPDCATLAEDIVRGEASLEDCVFVRIERLEEALKGREEHVS